MPLICKVIRVWKKEKKTDEFKFEFEDWWEFDGLGEEFCCQIGWSDRKKKLNFEGADWLRWWGRTLIEVIFFEELRLRMGIRDQEVRRLLVRHQTMGRLFGVWECWWRWWSLGFLGVKEKKEADEQEKNEVDLEHNSPHASGVFGRKIHWWGWPLSSCTADERHGSSKMMGLKTCWSFLRLLLD